MAGLFLCPKMKNFSVQIEWMMRADVLVEAENADHAQELVETGDLPKGEYAKGSFEVLDVTQAD